MRRGTSVLTGVALMAALAFVGPVGSAPGNKYSNTSDTHVCSQADGTITYNGPLKLWPPNHKLQPVYFVAQATDDTPDDTMVALDTTGTHEEFVDGEEMNGSGGGNGVNSGPDVDPPDDMDSDDDGNARTDHGVRSERSGQGDGRTYTLLAVATFDGDPCEGVDANDDPIAVPFKVEVPHDMRGGANWK